MEIPDDMIAQGAAPVAVTRRAGESYEDLQLRRKGFDTSGSSRRGGMSPLERAYVLAQQKAKSAAQQSRFEQTDSLKQREQQLREQQFEMQQKVHANRIADKQHALDQTGAFLDKVAEIGQQADSPRNSDGFYAKVLSIAGKYPAAINDNPAIRDMLGHYERQFTGSPQLPMALSELGQVDPTKPGMSQYLRTLPGKYPEARNDASFKSLFTDVAKAADAAALAAQAKAAGQVSERTTVQGPGGSTTMGVPVDKELSSLQREQSLHQRAYDSASNRRKAVDAMKVEDTPEGHSAKQALIDAADADILAAKKGLDETAALISTKRTASPPAQLAAPSNEQQGPPAPPVSTEQQGPPAPAAQPPILTQANDPSFDQTDDSNATPKPAVAASTAPDIHDLANAAIVAGRDPNAVKDRLIQLGGDPAKLNYGN